MPRTYTVKQVADMLGYSTNSIYAFLKQKRIKGVRVGKGRFRIPEEEMQRVLHLSKNAASNQQVINPATSQIILQGRTGLMGDAPVLSPAHDESMDAGRMGNVLTPNIFDWFVGTAAVVTGVALFLFNSVSNLTESLNFARFLPIIRVILVASGIGVLVSSVFREGKYWKRIFHAVLGLLGFLSAYGFARVGYYDGAVLYGGFAFVVGLAGVVEFGGVVPILLYATVIAFLIPVSMLTFPSDPHFYTIALLTGLSSAVIVVLSAVVAIVLIVFFWIGYSQNRSLFVFSTWAAALFDIVTAVWYAQSQYWSRAFFMVVVGYFTGLLSSWWPIQQYALRRHRFMLHGLFFVIGIFLIAAISVVGLLQQNMWQTKQADFANKLDVADSTIHTTFDSVKSALVVASANSQLVQIMQDKDIAQLNSFAKILYESNPNIRRLVFLDSKGTNIGLYPYGTFDDPNYAYREYFQKAKTAREPFVFNLFQAQTDQAGRYVVVVVKGLFDAKGVFVGVIAASVDIERLGLTLSQIADQRRGEQFMITDDKGTVLSYGNEKFIGTKAPTGHAVYRAINGETSVQSGATLEGVGGMMGYRPISSLGWALCLMAPDALVFDFTSSAIWSIFGVISCIMLMSVRVFTLVQSRTMSTKESGP